VPPPSVTITPNITTVKVFGSIQFICSATGFGDLSFAWYHNGSLLQTSSNSVESTLTISRVLPQQQGIYKCTVTSSHRQLRSDSYATLLVNGKYYIHMLNCDVVFLAPSFGSDVVLRQVSSNPSANTISVSLPTIDERDGPIRWVCMLYSLLQYSHAATSTKIRRIKLCTHGTLNTSPRVFKHACTAVTRSSSTWLLKLVMSTWLLKLVMMSNKGKLFTKGHKCRIIK